MDKEEQVCGLPSWTGWQPFPTYPDAKIEEKIIDGNLYMRIASSGSDPKRWEETNWFLCKRISKSAPLIICDKCGKSDFEFESLSDYGCTCCVACHSGRTDFGWAWFQILIGSKMTIAISEDLDKYVNEHKEQGGF